jgi:inward rectifier potassium channel
MNLNSKKESNSSDDLGLGSKVATDRSMHKDGSFNLQRVGEPKIRLYEIYHELITMSWIKFFVVITSLYFIANLIFAVVYYLIGVEHLTGIDVSADNLHKFLEAFFFSSQTLTTVGFGRIAPMGVLTSSVTAVESMLGVLVFAIATGVLYGRFSRPKAKLLYSSQSVIAPYKDSNGLMFRIANLRHSQLIELEVIVTLAYFEKGSKIRSFKRLDLERDKVSLLPTSWTIVHPIVEGSPLYGNSIEEIKEMKGELIVLLKAFDDTFSQTIYSRTSYHANEIIWGGKFLPMFSIAQDGHTVFDLRMIDTMEKLELA